MRKILLSTVFSVVFVAPSWAEDAAPITEQVEAAAVEQAAEKIEETADGVLKDTQEVVIEATSEPVEKAVAETSEQVADIPYAKEVSGPEALESAAGDEDGAVSQAVEQPAGDPAHQAGWGYNGGSAAAYWGTLDPAYNLCANGQAQSPINIAQFLQEDVPDILPSYTPSPLHVVNDGRTVQVSFQGGGGFRADNVNYDLVEVHFHTPSEHYLDGAPYPMEAHFLHKGEDGALAVIGVMMKIGEHHKVIEGIWQNTPIQAGEANSIDSVKINAADLMPESLEYYKYDGSLTVPPCTEGVRWHVLKEPIEVSEMQLKAFQALFPVNARPVQPLNDRVITGD